MNRRSWSWLVSGALMVSILLVGNFTLALVNTRVLRDDFDRVGHSNQVLLALGNITSLATNGETGVRGYVITGQPAYLAPYDTAVAAIGEQVEDFVRLTADDPHQQLRIAELRQHLAAKLQIMEQIVTARRYDGFDAATTLLVEGRAKESMAALRELVGTMMQEEREMLRQRAQRRDLTYRSAILSGLLSGVAGLAALAAFLVLLRRHLSKRAADALVIAEQAERLRTTLASIGDGVLTTDAAGCITQLNPVAETLTGWTTEEAMGRPLATIFHIVNDQTRRVVENPAMRALRDGVVVGLANHTLLIAKDGTEWPIDDSAAPIRCKDGDIVGCVLVFRDVTERRRVEVQRQQSEQRMRALVDATASIVWTTDEAGAFVGPQPSWRDYTGQSADEHGDLGWADALHPEDRERVLARWQAARARHGLYENAGRLWHAASESYRRFEARGVPILGDDGTVREWVGMIVDVEDRRRLEADRLQLVMLAENSTDFIGICNMQLEPTFVNKAGLEMVGLADFELARSVRVEEYFFPEDQAMILEEFLPSVLAKGSGEAEVRFRHFETGRALWMLFRVFALLDDRGEPVGLATVSRDITERRHLEDNLRRLAADLSEADRRKNEFLAMLAHELRNPLAPIRNALQLIQLKGGNGQVVEPISQMMERQVNHMTRLVDDLLDVSRISRGKIELRRERIELASAVRRAVEAATPLCKAMNQELNISLPPQAIYLHADAIRLIQAIGNVLNNASKFTDKGGRIDLTVERDGDQAVIRVRDNGIGMAADQLTRIFDMFTQVDTTLERTVSGLGIGLTLVKSLVEMHGGSVEAHSPGVDLGSELVMRLPILIELQEPLPEASDRASANLAARRILVVDDNRDAATSLAMLLKLTGHETHTAYDGVEALEAAAKVRPDAVLLDIGLPGLNGFGVARKIREASWGKTMVLVALTGWGSEQDREESRDAGFDGHVVKPVEYTALMSLLASLLDAEGTAP